ncbi:MAG: fructose-6-phosphate aldolase [Armatimonadetes bacterium]|nr:fructose-6-phosphate aldolase [Armatimonadota bacterium]
MKFFIDTANIDQIREVASWGIVDGVTTNPTLVAREGKAFEPTIKEICALLPDKPISAEVVSVDAEGIIREARELAQWAPNVVVKIPFIKEGMKALHVVAQEGIRVNCTLIFSAAAGLIAAKAGAAFISPFVGRLDDIGHDGMELVRQLVPIMDNYDFDTEIIVASVRTPAHVIEAAMLGADIATVPFDVLDKLFNHPMRDLGLANFLKDWEKYRAAQG